MSSKTNDDDESDNEEGSTLPVISETNVRNPSPPQKRPFSPVPSANTKKVKVEPSTINPKKKTAQPLAKNEYPNKTTVNNTIKKSQPISSAKPVPTIEDKPIKPPLSIKESTASISSEGKLDLSSMIRREHFFDIDVKSRLIAKIKPDPDSKPTNPIPKKKEPVPSPSKPNPTVTLKKPVQPPVNKPSQKLPVKTEPTSTSNKSPPNIHVKQEPSPNPPPSSNSTSSTVLISSLKKIPKKVAPPPPPPPLLPSSEKRIRSPMTPPSSSRNSDRVKPISPHPYHTYLKSLGFLSSSIIKEILQFETRSSYNTTTTTIIIDKSFRKCSK